LVIVAVTPVPSALSVIASTGVSKLPAELDDSLLLLFDEFRLDEDEEELLDPLTLDAELTVDDESEDAELGVDDESELTELDDDEDPLDAELADTELAELGVDDESELAELGVDDESELGVDDESLESELGVDDDSLLGVEAEEAELGVEELEDSSAPPEELELDASGGAFQTSHCAEELLLLIFSEVQTRFPRLAGVGSVPSHISTCRLSMVTAEFLTP
jgi:hypothetical protein